MKSNPLTETLIKYFSTIKSQDEEIEKIRCTLCQNEEFFPKLLFNSLDTNSKNFLTLDDFRLYLNKNNIEFQEQCLRRFIHNFDKDSDFSIDYNEFLGIITPKKDRNLKEKVISREPKEENISDSYDQKEFQEILISEFNLVKDLYQIADELKNQQDFTTYETFLEIVKNDKYITKDNLRDFLRDNEVEFDYDDVNILLYRIDADNDGQISYQEFLEIFFPYRENYTEKDINPVKERKKNYTIDDIELKDENYEIPPIKEEILNSLKPKKPKYNNQINLTNSLDNYNNFDDNNIINTNKNIYPCPGMTNKLTQSPLSNDYTMTKNIIYENNELNDNNNLLNQNQTSPTTLYKTNQNQNLEKPISEIDFDYTKQINKEPPKYKSNFLNKIQSFYEPNPPLKVSSIENIPKRDIINTRTNAYFLRDPSYLENRSEIKTTKTEIPNYVNDNNLNNNNYITEKIPLNICNRCHCPNPCTCYCQIDSNRVNLCTLIMKLVEQNNIIECHKESLSLCTDVNLTDLFEFFDKSNLNNISIVDFKQTLIELGLCPNPIDIKNIYDKYDKNKDNKLNYDEFCNMILPKKYSLAKLVSQRFPPSYFMGFTYDTKKIIFNLFQSIIDTNNENEMYKKWLFHNNENSGYDFFNMIKKNYANGILKEDIVCFLAENGKFLQPSEIALLMDLFDKNKDGLITYNEFLAEIAPKN